MALGNEFIYIFSIVDLLRSQDLYDLFSEEPSHISAQNFELHILAQEIDLAGLVARILF